MQQLPRRTALDRCWLEPAQAIRSLHRQFPGRPRAGPPLPPTGALFTHSKGGFYHDGRFATLDSVVDHYNTCLSLGLSSGEKSDLIQYLLSLTFGPRNAGKQSTSAPSGSGRE